MKRCVLSLLFVACASNNRSADVPRRTASSSRAIAWPEADRLFHSDPDWLGGDSAYSIDLGGGRVVWLFGDSFIATSPRRIRTESTMVHNSVAIQNGYDPSRATMRFFWDKTPARPRESFREEGSSDYLWPGHGVRLGDRLLLFFQHVRAVHGGLGFENAGWRAILVVNPDDDPPAWRQVRCALPIDSRGVFFASAVLVRDNLVEGYGFTEPKHEIYGARWTVDAARSCDLSRPEWIGDSPVIRDGATELSIGKTARGDFMEVQTFGLGAATIGVRRAPKPHGPWPAATMVFRPPESDRPNTLVYAGKAHGELAGAEVVVTYASNDLDLGRLVRDTSIYYPRFVRIDW